MKKLKFNLTGFLFGVVLSLFFGTIMLEVGANPIPYVVGTLAIFSLVDLMPIPKGIAGENYQTLFGRRLAEKFYPGNDFLQSVPSFARELPSANDLQGLTALSIPTQSTGPGVIENPTVWPLPVKNKENANTTINVDYLATEVDRIGYDSERKATYNKLLSTADQHARVLFSHYASKIAYEIANSESDKLVVTTGTTNNVGPDGSARKALTSNDLTKVLKLLRQTDMPGLCYGLIPPTFEKDIRDIDKFVDADKFGTREQIANGLLGRIFGIEFWIRNDLPTYANDEATKKKHTAAVVANDRFSGIFYKPLGVVHGHTNIHPMVSEERPEYGGRIANAHMAGGGGHVYSDELGVVTLIQD